MYCKEHAPEGYVDVKNKRCEVAGCQKHPSHGPAGGQPLFCKDHGEERGMTTTRAHVVRQWGATSDQFWPCWEESESLQGAW